MLFLFIFNYNAADILAIQITAGLQPRGYHFIPFARRQMKYRIVIKLYGAGFFFPASMAASIPAGFIAGDFIHIFPADRPDLLQHIDHPVNRRRPDMLIYFYGLIINLLTARAFLFQNNVQEHLPLFCDPAAPLF